MKSKFKTSGVYIKVNDIFDELSEENKRLNNELLFANNCLNVLNKFKVLLKKFYERYETYIKLEDKQQLIELEEDFISINKSKDQIERTVIETEDLIENNVKEFTESIDENNELYDEKTTNGIKIDTNSQKSCKSMTSNVNNILSENVFPKKKSCPLVETTVRKLSARRKGNVIHIKPKTKPKPKPEFRPKKVIKIPEPEEEPNSLLLLRRNNFDVKTQTYVCPNPSCDKSYRIRSSLYKHFHLFHTLRKDYICEHLNCNKSFKALSILRAHSITHSDLKPFVCPYDGCDYRCKRKKEIQTHFVVHSDIRSFKCNDCEKCFKLESKLKRHELVHKSQPSYKCSVKDCLKVFANDFKLQYHNKKVHRIAKLKICDWPGCDYQTLSYDRINDHKRLHTGEKPHPCHWPDCGKRFRLRQHLHNHIMVHKDLKPIACVWPGCQHRFRTNGNMKLHLKVHQK